MSEETLKLFANIESETGLKAFELYMDLKWGEFYASCFGNAVGVIIFISIIGWIVYAISSGGGTPKKEKQ